MSYVRFLCFCCCYVVWFVWFIAFVPFVSFGSNCIHWNLNLDRFAALAGCCRHWELRVFRIPRDVTLLKSQTSDFNFSHLNAQNKYFFSFHSFINRNCRRIRFSLRCICCIRLHLFISLFSRHGKTFEWREMNKNIRHF